MKTLIGMFGACALLIAASLATAQGPGRGEPRDGRSPASADDLVTRMMAFDKNKDGKLTMAEVTDERLHRLVERADADKDGFVTKEELTALAAREQISNRGGGPGGFGPPGGGPGGPGGPRMMGGMPRPGEILPGMLRQRLNLTAAAGEAGRRPSEGSGRQAREDPDRRAAGSAQGHAGSRPRRSDSDHHQAARAVDQRGGGADRRAAVVLRAVADLPAAMDHRRRRRMSRGKTEPPRLRHTNPIAAASSSSQVTLGPAVRRSEAGFLARHGALAAPGP